MKKVKFTLLLLLVTLLLCSCNKGEEKPETLRVLKSSVLTYNDGEEETTKYYHDEVVELSNGVYQVKGSRVTADETTEVQWFFFADGTPLGERSYYMDQQYADSFLFLDNRLDCYIAGLDNFDYMEDDVIYYDDGRYEEVEVEDDYIQKTTTYSEDGNKEFEAKFDDYGNLARLAWYDIDGNTWLSIKYKYKDISIE